MKIYLLHPLAVHFPIALLLTALFFKVGDLLFKKEGWGKTSTTLLFLGTLAAVIAAGLGLLAEETVPHVPDAWEYLYTHKRLGLVTAGLFSVLSVWRFFFTDRWPKAFFWVWILASVVLIVTAYFGGELVFQFGVGYHQ
ncbi:MAG: DUF2231 domain-containing protein [Deltaproteobacteria bacterium]|nr:DUF2231 domain-containing protein [Deltaproteobacteria bacterium]MBI3017170.1 DUF2231 domain-containing protein [Deltaproteobacteria bacterium]